MGKTFTRRRFLHSAAAASLVGVSACATSSRYRGPVSGGPRLAVVGLRAQGLRHLRALLRRTDLDVTAVCDPDPRALGHAMALAVQHKRPVPPFLDVREMLESSEIDAVVIATPDHWHCLLTLWACQAGKHVYVESPPSHSIEEGSWMLAAARRYERSIRVAMPLRSHPGIREGVTFLHRGGLGRILDIKSFCFLNRRPLGRSAELCVLPEGLDFDLWAGPAPLEVPRRRSLHGDWRFDWRTGNGDTGEWGLHVIDLARWIAKVDTFPETIWTCGGRLGPKDDGETPNTVLAGFQYPTATLVYEACSLRSVGGREKGAAQVGMGVLVSGTKGRMLLDAQMGVCLATGFDEELLGEFGGRGDPLGEFVEDLADNRLRPDSLQTAMHSTAMVHLLQNAQRTGAACSRTDALRDLAEARPILDGFYSLDGQLGRSGMEFDESGSVCSGWRSVDRQTGDFRDAANANGLRRRTYRAPFSPDLSIGPA